MTHPYLVYLDGRIETEHVTYAEAMEQAKRFEADMRQEANRRGEFFFDDCIRILQVRAEWRLELDPDGEHWDLVEREVPNG